MDTVRCDFCNARAPAWAFPCASFDTGLPATPAEAEFARAQLEPVGDVYSTSGGDWLACHTCRRLVVGGDRRRLARRSAEGFIRANPELPLPPRPVLVAAIEDLQGRFWAHRNGGPRRLAEQVRVAPQPPLTADFVPGPPPAPPDWLRRVRGDAT